MKELQPFPYSVRFESTAFVQIDMPGGKREKTEKNQSTLSGLFDCMRNRSGLVSGFEAVNCSRNIPID